MKKIFAWILLGSLLLELTGCGAAASAPVAETEVPVQTTEAAETKQETIALETEPIPEKPIFLKVSAITFSLVGESEDIYLGLADREDVTWESDAPSVISVENGILTAKGVGSTTIRAQCGDQKLECTAACIAQDEQELTELGPEILRKPKRMVPDVDLTAPCTFYDQSALVGDSICLMLMQTESPEDYLGNLLVLARNGTSMIGLVRRFKNIYYQGAERNIEDIIAESGVERMYILLGSNDIACPDNRVSYLSNWEILVERLYEKSPDLQIVILSNTPRYTISDNGKEIDVSKYNQMIREDNAKLVQFSKDHGCPYLDLSYYIVDHEGNMAEEYNRDGYHMNDLGYMQWIKFMRFYAEYEMAGGIIS